MKTKHKIILGAAIAALGAVAVAPDADASYRARSTRGGFDDASAPTSLWDRLVRAFGGETTDAGVRMDDNG